MTTEQVQPRGLTRRDLLRASAALGLTALPGARAPASSGASPAAGPIMKPLPPELFTVFGTNAETKWEALRGQGYHTPIDRFFVRNHTATPTIDAETWRLKLFGSGLHGNPTVAQPIEFSYADLCALPSQEISAFIECAGNGRSFYTSQQGQTVSGSAWKLGAVGVARWRGVRLSTVLRRAGLTPTAVDVMPSGLDAHFISNGVDLGAVRRPLPIAKALKDVLLAYEMNGEVLPPDHGFPVRLVVPSWIGIASIKWVGSLEVSDQTLTSPWNTEFYRLFGPDYPAEGSLPLTRQVVKSAFELPWPATLQVDRRHLLTGRSWSGNGAVRRVEVTADGGTTWRPARPIGRTSRTGWLRWEIPWRPTATGNYQLLARGTDDTGVSQPEIAPYNTLGYLFGAVVRHPVVIA